MKIVTVCAALALLAAGCGQQATGPSETRSASSESSPTAEPCVPPVTREIALTAADARDVLEATVIGADCENATLLLTLRKADGALLWTHSMRATDTGAFVSADDSKPVAPAEGMASFLADVFKEVRIGKTGAGPDWPEGAEQPEDSSSLYYVSPLPREAYLILRRKNVPMTCVQAEMGTIYCVAFDPELNDVANTFYSSSP